jgi:hypothetical protein
MQEHFDRLEDFRARRLPEVKGFMVTTDVPDSAGRRPTGIMKMDGISLLDAEEDELARGLTPVMAERAGRAFALTRTFMPVPWVRPTLLPSAAQASTDLGN